MKSKRAIYKMLELTVACALGGILSYFLTKFYDTSNFGYFWGFGAALIFVAIFGFIFYYSVPYENL